MLTRRCRWLWMQLGIGTVSATRLSYVSQQIKEHPRTGWWWSGNCGFCRLVQYDKRLHSSRSHSLNLSASIKPHSAGTQTHHNVRSRCVTVFCPRTLCRVGKNSLWSHRSLQRNAGVWKVLAPSRVVFLSFQRQELRKKDTLIYVAEPEKRWFLFLQTRVRSFDQVQQQFEASQSLLKRFGQATYAGHATYTKNGLWRKKVAPTDHAQKQIEFCTGIMMARTDYLCKIPTAVAEWQWFDCSS